MARSQESEEYDEGLLRDAFDAIDNAVIQFAVGKKYQRFEARQEYIHRIIEALDMYINRAGGR